MVDLSVLEARFYVGLLALFLFGILALLLLLAGMFWEGIALLVVVAFATVFAYVSSKKRCPRCNRLVLDSAYEFCPHCGYNFKERGGKPR